MSSRTLVAPSHAIFVHFSIALTSASFAFDFVAHLFGASGLLEGAWWLLIAGFAATLFAVMSGIISRIALPVGEGEARRFLRLHMALGPIFFGMLFVHLIWRTWLRENAAAPETWYFVAAALTVLVMTFQGYLGGELVYRWGLAVIGRYERLGGGTDR